MTQRTKTWFRLEIIYNYRGETKRFEYINCNAATLKTIREGIIAMGLQVPIDSATWVIIFPWSIDCLTVTRQKDFLSNSQSDTSKIVFGYGTGKI